MNIPEEWKSILEKMPELKELFEEQQECDEYEIVPPYFFHYFRPDNYEKCREFFCYENGQAVYKNLVDIFEATKNNYCKDNMVAAYFTVEKKEILEDELKSYVQKYINGINYFLEDEEEFYDFTKMNIKVMKKEEFDKKYDYYNIDACELHDYIGDSIIYEMPDEEQNPIACFYEPLYQIDCDYDLAHYIIWPLLGKNNEDNPFTGYKLLWENGYKPFIVDKENIVIVY